MQHEESRSFQRDDVRHHVIPAYMALVKQVDDHLGRLLQFLEARGRLADTMIVLTSDHGDYFGDHWLGEKELFYEASVRFRPARLDLGLAPHEARVFMVRTAAWKYIHYEHFRPQLFDLNADPDEFHDLGVSPAHAAVQAALHARLFTWLRNRRTRTTIADTAIAQRTATTQRRGILIGVW